MPMRMSICRPHGYLGAARAYAMLQGEGRSGRHIRRDSTTYSSDDATTHGPWLEEERGRQWQYKYAREQEKACGYGVRSCERAQRLARHPRP